MSQYQVCSVKIKEKENDVFSSWPHSHPPVLSLTEMFLLIQLAPSCIVLHALAHFLADTHQALLLFNETKIQLASSSSRLSPIFSPTTHQSFLLFKETFTFQINFHLLKKLSLLKETKIQLAPSYCPTRSRLSTATF